VADVEFRIYLTSRKESPLKKYICWKSRECSISGYSYLHMFWHEKCLGRYLWVRL